MPGKKRAADEATTEKRETRRSKVAKTEGAKTAGKAGTKGTARLKTSMGASTFKSRALPLHVNITSTPPAVAEGQETAAPADPGFLGSTTLAPSSFSTGSFGWKANKRMVIELPKGEGEEGEGEKVHVMLTINATVIGSKNVRDDGEEQEGQKEGEGTGTAEETAGETAESKPEEAPEAEAKESEDKPADAEEGAA
ncbi:hypothetical protein PAXINDRAFT_179852 [Paxillus involutus ATCC 200175]|nr:hypothetical protein PAXINDRAFT_179852 [Paxillus involutus ATCC 200175]